MLISIIVPVFNRADEIDNFLASFLNQNEAEFEVIIVDDGSTDNLKDVIQKYAQELKITYYFQQNQGPGAARNLGMSKASGDYYVFIDSDCTVPENYIKNLITHISEDEFDAFGGPDTYLPDFPPFLKAVNYSMTSFLGTGGTRGSKGKSVAKYYPRSFNMGIKKEVYKKIGGMNKLRHGQDMDFSNRIYKAGFKVKYLHDVLVYHKRRTSPRRFFKQIFNWGVARINLGRIDKNMLKPVHCLPFVILMGFILTFFLMLFMPYFKVLFKFELFLTALLAVIAFIQSLVEYRQFSVAIYSIITIYLQIIGYGLGFGYGLLKSLTGGKKGFINGFTRNYYK
ncbi:glycosyltransferase [Candidatus Cloacimonadota bacterium]